MSDVRVALSSKGIWFLNAVTLCLACCLLPVLQAVASAEATQKRAFTVHDSVSWTYLVPFTSVVPAGSPPGIVLPSPGGSHFLVHTRSGDVAKNVIMESLRILSAADVKRYGDSKELSSAPQARTVVAAIASKEAQFLSNIRWLNETEFAYLATGSNDRTQVFVAEVNTSDISQVTFSDTDVVAFSCEGPSVLYYARTPVSGDDPVVVVENQTLTQLLAGNSNPDWLEAAPVELFAGVRGHKEAIRLPLPSMRLQPGFRHIWISPAGDFALTLAPTTHAPKHWAAYRVPDYERWGFTADWRREDPISMDLANRARYMLVDLRKRSVRPLFDAPLATVTFNQTPQHVFWLPNGKSVIVTNTYLPLQGVAARVRAERELKPAIVEVDIESGAISMISWESVRQQAAQPMGASQESRILAVQWDRSSATLGLTKRWATGSRVEHQSYRKRGAQWRLEDTAESAAKEAPPPIAEYQSLNERPKLYLTDPDAAASVRKVVFDPNPQAEQLHFGHASVLQWTDGNGTQWQGGLLLPPAYVDGQRYPLIVQTHGFRQQQFLLDGPAREGSTAFAAQALASAGFVVLQVEDNFKTITMDDREGALVADGLHAAIDLLIGRGLVDGSNIGVIGFSRTGYHALHLLAKYPQLVKAVTISDALQGGYWQYLASATNNPGTEKELSSLTGGGPLLDASKWFAANPLYKIDRSVAAIRLEENGEPRGMQMWETYALLRKARRPVELVLFPQGGHLLKMPRERLASQGGNVDWFRFWLQGYEDTDDSKQQQYVRWRKLRDLTPH